MWLAKARDLMRLAEMAVARHQGVSLAEIAEAFDADHRTAQRMARALEDTFPGVEIRTDEDRRRRHLGEPHEIPGLGSDMAASPRGLSNRDSRRRAGAPSNRRIRATPRRETRD